MNVIMGSHSFKGAARGLYGEDHTRRDFPIKFHMEYSVYSIRTVLIFLTGAIIIYKSIRTYLARNLSCIHDKSLLGMF